MIDFNVTRLILKEDDILVIQVPQGYFATKSIVKSIYQQIKKQLLPRPNKILILPDTLKLSVIGKDKVEEYVSHVDLWNLFEDERDEI